MGNLEKDLKKGDRVEVILNDNCILDFDGICARYQVPEEWKERKGKPIIGIMGRIEERVKDNKIKLCVDWYLPADCPVVGNSLDKVIIDCDAIDSYEVWKR